MVHIHPVTGTVFLNAATVPRVTPVPHREGERLPPSSAVGPVAAWVAASVQCALLCSACMFK